jgi:hypothetical protein
MEVLFEILFEFIGEVLLQIFFEFLAEFGLHCLGAPFKKPPNPWLAAIGYALFGAIAGGLSLWLVPHLFIHTHTGQIVNLLLAPVVAGLAMSALGAWRRRRHLTIIRLDKFAYGYVFALAMALVRFAFAG